MIRWKAGGGKWENIRTNRTPASERKVAPKQAAPVKTQTDTFGYRTSKFVARHSVGVAACWHRLGRIAQKAKTFSSRKCRERRRFVWMHKWTTNRRSKRPCAIRLAVPGMTQRLVGGQDTLILDGINPDNPSDPSRFFARPTTTIGSLGSGELIVRNGVHRRELVSTFRAFRHWLDLRLPTARASYHSYRKHTWLVYVQLITSIGHLRRFWVVSGVCVGGRPRTRGRSGESRA